MAKGNGGPDQVRVQLATRIPRALHRALKIRCVETGTAVMTFVEAALRERLRARPTRTQSVVTTTASGRATGRGSAVADNAGLSA